MISPAEPRLYQVVSDQIRALLRQDRIAPGARLPSERELATRLRVSRSSLREAMIVLEVDGTVAVQGSTRVLACDAGSLARREPDAREVTEARRVVGALVAAAAAKHATGTAVDAIAAAVDGIERGVSGDEGHGIADREFMLAVAQATGNEALVGVVNYLWQARHEIAAQADGAPAARAKASAPRHEVLGAIVARDATAARQAMQSHLA